MAYKRACSYEIIMTSLLGFIIRGSYFAFLELMQPCIAHLKNQRPGFLRSFFQSISSRFLNVIFLSFFFFNLYNSCYSNQQRNIVQGAILRLLIHSWISSFILQSCLHSFKTFTKCFLHVTWKVRHEGSALTFGSRLFLKSSIFLNTLVAPSLLIPCRQKDISQSNDIRSLA